MLRLPAIRRASVTIARRTYASKTKTPKPKVSNVNTKARVPVKEMTLDDGSIFVVRESPVPTKVQATAPPLRQPYEKKYNLSDAQIAEMRQLRQQDPTTWTRKKLADKFGCSELFVSIAAPTTKHATLEASSSSAAAATEEGYRRQLIKRNRERRRALW
ncbi:hypothetical protein LRAMOSA10609 [Lichtheimia ramosa]|uniref:Mitochondrial ribosomal protein subunit L20-domain-containing protein n=1 Tax=Lichtheimia ramosa TaxID=688394 RepID=A0A077WQ21_9FUNG|nr:hypothetical protein LRAMOSA10609 [Lichtheimia ramosa]